MEIQVVGIWSGKLELGVEKLEWWKIEVVGNWSGWELEWLGNCNG
jgi:hypothetical protein